MSRGLERDILLGGAFSDPAEDGGGGETGFGIFVPRFLDELSHHPRCPVLKPPRSDVRSEPF